MHNIHIDQLTLPALLTYYMHNTYNVHILIQDTINMHNLHIDQLALPTLIT